LIETIAVYALPVVLAITLHEAAHGYVARHFGDLTAYKLGRVSLNPIRHMDWMGTIVVPLAILIGSHIAGATSGILFGWAKPVPVNYYALRNPRRDMLWVAAAGPASNVAQALVWAALLKLGQAFDFGYGDIVTAVASAGIMVNVVLTVLNLIPVLPLDGGRIVFSLLPERLSYRYARVEPYGLIVLVIILVADTQNRLLGPVTHQMTRLVAKLFHIDFEA
jgi:Zn-dependent protease